MDLDFIAKFEDEHGWTPDCAYDIIGEENIGGKSVKLSDIVSEPLSPEAKEALLKVAKLSCLEQAKLMKGGKNE